MNWDPEPVAFGKASLLNNELVNISQQHQQLAFWGLERLELENLCLRSGFSSVHARDLFKAAYKDLRSDPWQRPGLPKSLALTFGSSFSNEVLKIHSEHLSRYDSSVKFVVELNDGAKVEMVLMPESKRVTLCISSQVGCAQGCVFCHTGRMGLTRNLSAAEIVGQVWIANQWISAHPQWLEQVRLPSSQRITNLVFMGMGEPLDNPEAVGKAITILVDPFGMNMAKRRISVSTAGHLEGLHTLLSIHPDVRLAISVHSAFEAERSKIMPINRRWSLTELFNTLRHLPTHRENGLLLQYTLISGVNDSIDHARQLVSLVKGMNVKINVIPLNPVGPSRLKSPEVERVEFFRNEIYQAGLRVMVRYSKGQDIGGACGQLVTSQKNS